MVEIEVKVLNQRIILFKLLILMKSGVRELFT